MKQKQIKEISVVSGSRRVVIKDLNSTDGYYSDNAFRKNIMIC